MWEKNKRSPKHFLKPEGMWILSFPEWHSSHKLYYSHLLHKLYVENKTILPLSWIHWFKILEKRVHFALLNMIVLFSHMFQNKKGSILSNLTIQTCSVNAKYGLSITFLKPIMVSEEWEESSSHTLNFDHSLHKFSH